MCERATGRRRLLIGGLAVAGLAALPACGDDQRPAVATDTPPPATPDAALARLLAGNKRWAAGRPVHRGQDAQRRREVAAAQNPFATVLTCIDSRVSPEIVFDAGIGDLFVIRSAAQCLDPLLDGSVEYGPAERATPLIVVMGHQRCGAVHAVWEAHQSGKQPPGELRAIATALKPAYERARRADEDRMAREQVRLTTRRLAHEKVLSGKLRKRELMITGVYYCLDSGRVELLS